MKLILTEMSKDILDDPFLQATDDTIIVHLDRINEDSIMKGLLQYVNFEGEIEVQAHVYKSDIETYVFDDSLLEKFPTINFKLY